MSLHIWMEQKPYQTTTEIWIIERHQDGREFIVEPLNVVFKEINPSQRTDPSLTFAGPIAKELFPALHAAMIQSGYLAPEKSEAIDSIKYHLEDMRKLVFKGDPK